jgi:SAM-dependent methyltransferase
MLWMANVGKDDVVYDLGSGDGRIVIAAVRDFGARRAVGIESNPQRIQESRENARRAGVTDKVEFIQGDLFTTDISQGSVVTLFLGHAPNVQLRPKLFRTLKPGTRIVSHQFGMGEWEPDKTLSARTLALGMWSEGASPFSNNQHVPDYSGNEMHFGTSDKIAMWVVPAPVAGIWRGKIDTAQGPQDCELVFHQRLSQVTGKFHESGQPNLSGPVHVDLWGDHLRFECIPEHMAYGQFQLQFDGHVHKNTMQGTLAVTERGQLREVSWQAERDSADFSGTWQWPCPTGEGPVKLKVERAASGVAATYIDQDQAIPVPDIYDGGGGFYFTLLIGRDADGLGLRITKDTGWLVAEGIIDGGSLKGKFEFYPYYKRGGGGLFEAPAGSVTQDIIRDWTPKLIQP